MGLKDIIGSLPVDYEVRRELRRVADFAQYSSKEYFDQLKEEGIGDPRFHSGRGESILLKITLSQLADLFGVSYRTVQRWIKIKKLKLTLKDIVDFYSERRKV